MLVGDIIHIYTTYYYLGEKVVMDVGNWNGMTWGNIGVTVALLFVRLAWLLTVGIKGSSEHKKNE
jgi:hypothetical protein